MSSPPAQI